MTASDVLSGSARWSCERGDAIEWASHLPERSCSVVIFSPPYESQRTYGINFKRTGQNWVDWMRDVVKATCRLSSGLVLVNMSAPVRDYMYSPVVEWLVADLTRIDGIVCGPSPYAWVKSINHPEADGNSTPGSGGPSYQRRDWEPIYAFAFRDRLPLVWSDNTAFGKPPKYGAGGAFSNRDTNGVRANDPWKNASRGGSGCDGRRANGEKKQGPKRESNRAKARAAGIKMRVITVRTKEGMISADPYLPPLISNPGNVIRAPVGGGKCGSPIAHIGEAPMSLSVVERFVCWFAPPDSVVGDPFTGTGTTADAAVIHGRRFIGCDLRDSQVRLCERRMATVTPNLFG